MASRLLDRIRTAGFEGKADGGEVRVTPASELTGEQRSFLRERREEVRGELLRERAVRELDLVPVDAATGLPKLWAREPATERQAERLRDLTRDPALAPHRERVLEIVEDALGDGLSEAGSWGLIGYLGGRIARSSSDDSTASPAGGECSSCGRKIGPTSTRCGSCKRARHGRDKSARREGT